MAYKDPEEARRVKKVYYQEHKELLKARAGAWNLAHPKAYKKHLTKHNRKLRNEFLKRNQFKKIGEVYACKNCEITYIKSGPQIKFHFEREHRKEVNKMAQEPKKTLQYSILERFMNKEEIAKFMADYQGSVLRAKTRGGNYNEVKPEEFELLRDYLNTTISSGQLREKHGIVGTASLYTKVGKIALRLVAENKEKLGLIEAKT